MSGLTLVTTPIGNLGDITERARETLKNGHFFLCEDTRNTKNLLNLLGITLEGKIFASFHDHSNEADIHKIIAGLKEGHHYILVSDAGSPMISDPAFPLVKKAIELGISVDSCPGVNAVTLALELSGLPTSPFIFHGFLGRDKKDRKQFYQEIQIIPGTHIFFEGASRVEDTLTEMAETFKENSIVVARELTKKFQSIYRFKGSEFSSMKEVFVFKGEFVVLVSIENKKESSFNEIEVNKLANEIMHSGNKPKIVAKLLSEILGIPIKDAYQKLQNSNE